MIIIDLQQLMLSNFAMGAKKYKIVEFSDDLFRHMVLKSIRSNLMKFKTQYGNLVIASDGYKYWRKDLFPNYKWKRRDQREKDDIDWNAVYASINKIRDEVREWFPYPLINLPHVEADDIIATLVFNNKEPIMIVSSDQDFIQLQLAGTVNQYDPRQKKLIKHDHPRCYMFEHIIRGDRGDGIPNIKSPDSCFVDGKRQFNLSKVEVESWVNTLDFRTEEGSKDYPASQIFEGEMLRNWHRNKALIDL